MQPLELGRGIGPELVGKHLARALERRQRLGLAARAIQREHQVGPHPFAERVPRRERLELGDDGGVPAHRDLGRDPMFGRRQAQLLQPRGLAPKRGLLRHVGERVRTPERERVGEGRGGRSRIVGDLGLPLLHEGLEPLGVDLVGRRGEHVPAVAAFDPPVTEQFAEAVDVRLQGVARTLGEAPRPRARRSAGRPHDPVRSRIR